MSTVTPASDQCRARPAQAAAADALVLIVDDNESKRIALKSVLLPLGHTIVEADSGIAALRCVLDNDFCVILLDVRMPVMDGFETAALIRKRQQSETTPIVFITAHRRDDIVDNDGCPEGPVDFISSPVRSSELREKVAAFAEQFLERAELRAAALHVQPVVLPAAVAHIEGRRCDDPRPAITGILRLTAELLDGNGIGDRGRGYVEIIRHHAQLLERVVDDVPALDPA
ncbi:MAG: domain S-box [Ilumatobacteraceae bacterium]|nr:domain S-box [Ilumatobacteraceae bacterium]